MKNGPEALRHRITRQIQPGMELIKQVLLPLLEESRQFRLPPALDLKGIVTVFDGLQNCPGTDHAQGIAQDKLSRMEMV